MILVTVVAIESPVVLGFTSSAWVSKSTWYLCSSIVVVVVVVVLDLIRALAINQSIARSRALIKVRAKSSKIKLVVVSQELLFE